MDTCTNVHTAPRQGGPLESNINLSCTLSKSDTAEMLTYIAHPHLPSFSLNAPRERYMQCFLGPTHSNAHVCPPVVKPLRLALAHHVSASPSGAGRPCVLPLPHVTRGLLSCVQLVFSSCHAVRLQAGTSSSSTIIWLLIRHLPFAFWYSSPALSRSLRGFSGTSRPAYVRPWPRRRE